MAGYQLLFKNQSKSWASNDYNCSKRCFDDRNFHNFNDKISTWIPNEFLCQIFIYTVIMTLTNWQLGVYKKEDLLKIGLLEGLLTNL